MSFSPLGLINRGFRLKYMAPMGLGIGAVLANKLSENEKTKIKKPIQHDSFQKNLPPAEKDSSDAAFWMNDEDLSFLAVNLAVNKK